MFHILREWSITDEGTTDCQIKRKKKEKRKEKKIEW